MSCSIRNLVSFNLHALCPHHQDGVTSPTNLFYLRRNQFSASHRLQLRFCAVGGDSNVFESTDSDKRSLGRKGPAVENGNHQAEPLTSKEVLKRLRRYGISGILSYGLLNTAYYLTAFLVAWFYIAPAPSGMGYLTAAQRFLKVMAMVWAGSQVTKLIRAGGALALAPFVDKGLSWFTLKFKFESQAKAFLAIVCCCLGLAVMLFLVVTLLWA